MELPFALWLYLGIEQLPLAAEESHDPKQDMPRGILYGLLTLIAGFFLTVVLSAGIAPGAAKWATSNEPLFLGFQTIFGAGLKARVLALAACTGLIASFHTIIFAYGRQIYSLSRARLFSDVALGDARQARDAAPRAAGGLGAGLRGGPGDLPDAAGRRGRRGAAQHGGVRRRDGVHPADGLVHSAAAALSEDGAAVSQPRRESPGPSVAAVIAAVTLFMLFANPDYNKGVIGAAVWFLLGIVYYAVRGRHRLVLSPEEESAFRERQEKPPV